MARVLRRRHVIRRKRGKGLVTRAKKVAKIVTVPYYMGPYYMGLRKYLVNS